MFALLKKILNLPDPKKELKDKAINLVNSDRTQN